MTYVLNKNTLQNSPRQARHLEYINQFSTDIRYIEGKSNIVADALSRMEVIQKTDLEVLAKSQEEDEEMKQYREIRSQVEEDSNSGISTTAIL